nr:VWA domain-containing protein [Ktedonobacteraceae bacterium]
VVYGLLAPPPGFHTLRVTLQASQDTIAGNNEAAAFINVQGTPHVLVIEGSPGEGHNIVAALRATGLGVVVGTPNDVPTSLDGLANYGSVVLANVPAVELGTTRMQVLQSFVRDLGRGLVVSGGQNSYGVGGYANTPLEQTLPVKMDIPQHKDTPAIAVVLIIESLENETGVNISKEAAKGVVNLLTPRDQVGISAGDGMLAVPMQHVTDRAAIDKAIDAMNPSDPGSYTPDLINAENVLLHTDAKIKHVILLGDGDANSDFQPQVYKMASEHITVSTVATNAQTYAEFNMMAQLASWGKGRFYRADDPATIPQILLKETQQAARRAVIEESFVPAIVGNHPIMTGLGPLPGLGGYVATTPKAAAQLVLISHRDDPVLAIWQYGLGRVAAWTSDAQGLWTARWLSWDGAARWWANLVTWTLPTPDSALNVNAVVVGGTGQLTVDLPPGTPVGAGTQQQVQAVVITPDLHQQIVTLQPTAPGRWQGDFPTGQVGAYLLRITWQAGDKGSAGRLTSTTGLVVPYSPEYRSLGTDTRFLTLLARAGGGQLLSASDYPAAFNQNLPPVSASLPITFWLLALAALLLPVDVAARRLVNLEFLGMGLRWLKGARKGEPLKAREGEQLKDTVIGSTLGTVRAHREERRQRVSSPIPRAASSEAREATPVAKPSPRNAERQAPKVAPPDVSVSEKLLEAKRQRARERVRREDIQP